MARTDRAGHLLAVMLIALPLGCSGPARAQLSGSVSVASDDRWRGRSLSSGRPIASATIGYDTPVGAYIDASATAAWTRNDGIALIGGAIDAGYAWRTAHGLAIDIGAMRQQFTRDYSGGRTTGYTEIYAGLSSRSVAARLSYSPDYFRIGSHTLYLGADAVLRPATDWRLTAHAGAIAYLSPIRTAGLRTIEYDYGIGIARRFEALELRLNLSSGGPDRDYYGNKPRSKTALTAGMEITF